MGWSLELGAIERLTRLGVPHYDSTDRFELIQGGGRQLLVYDAAAGFYRTHTEGAFLKTQFDATNNLWLVTDKKGTKYFFGATADSKQVDPNNSAKVFRWSLNRVDDIHGNFLTISYTADAGQIYLNEVNYTGNATLTPFAKVQFVWEQPRYKKFQTYRSGFRVVTNKRLQKIIVKADDAVQREYHFLYSQSPFTQKDLLTTVKHFGSDSLTALPDTTFAYYGSEKGFAIDAGASIPSGLPFSTAGSPATDLGVRIADMNSDGFPDLVRNYFNAGQAHLNNIYLNNKSNGWAPNGVLPTGDCSAATPVTCVTFIRNSSRNRTVRSTLITVLPSWT